MEVRGQRLLLRALDMRHATHNAPSLPNGWLTMPLVGAAAVGALVLLYLTFERRRWRRGWLSELIAGRLSTVSKQNALKRKAEPIGWRSRLAAIRLVAVEFWDGVLGYFQNKFLEDLRLPQIPSLASSLLIVTFIAAFFVVPHLPSIAGLADASFSDWWHWLTDDLELEESKADSLIIGSFSGLVVVVIALIVFVAESIRDNDDDERKRVLVRISWLWPLGVAATIIPFGFLWSVARRFTVMLEVVVAVFTLVAFFRVISWLLDPKSRARNRLAMLRSTIRPMISESVRQRIGNSILMEQLGAGKRIENLRYTPSPAWIEGRAQRYIFVDAPEEGRLADIQLDELQKLTERLDQHARETLGFGLRKRGPDAEARLTEDGATVAEARPLPVREAYLLKRYLEEIPRDSVFYGKQRALLALPEEFEKNPVFLREVEMALTHVFRFTKEESSSVSVRREMQATKDQLSHAISAHALGAIEELSQIYIQIAEEFLTLLVEFGGGYSAEQAAKERRNSFESWTEIRWLLDDLRELVALAARSGSTDVLSPIAFLPFAIAIRAIRARDHYLFQQFYQFAPFLYMLAQNIVGNSAFRGFLTRRSRQWPKEVADFYIARDLEANDVAVPELEQTRDFALYSFRVFQDLLKLIADKRDATEFATAASEFRRLYARFRGSEDRPSILILRLQLQHAQSDSERQKLEVQLERDEKRNEIATALNNALDEIFLALSGRILAQRMLLPDDPNVGAIWDAIKAMMPDRLDRLASVYASANDIRVTDPWGWSQWDFVADGEAHFVDTYSKLNRAFAVLALERLARLSEQQREVVRLPASHSLAEIAREGNPQGILVTLDEIEAHPAQWEVVLGADERAHIDLLRRRLADARAADEAQEYQKTREAPLDPAKVTDFRRELKQAFLERGRFRKIVEADDRLILQLGDESGKSVPSLGFNQLDDKNAFIAQERVSYAGWGRGYGEGLATGEDEAVFAAMINGAGVQQEIGRGTLVKSISTILATSAMAEPIVFQSLAFETENPEIRQNPAFTPKFEPQLRSRWKEFNGFMGVLTVADQQIPVFDVFTRRVESQNKILLADLKRFLRWTQFSPADTPEESPDVDELLLIRVIDLNLDEERRNQLISENPPWLAEKEDRVAYLCGRVVLNIYEKFQLEILRPEAGVCLTLTGVPSRGRVSS